MAVRGVAFVVFLLPVIISLFVGGWVMAFVLKEPDRELNMWQFQFPKAPEIVAKPLKIIGLENEYSASTPVEVRISVTNSAFDCGDLYITIYDLSTASKQVVTQRGYFDQCFVGDNSLLPVDDEFSETVENSGKYEILAEINDKAQKETLTVREKFTVA